MRYPSSTKKRRAVLAAQRDSKIPIRAFVLFLESVRAPAEARAQRRLGDDELRTVDDRLQLTGRQTGFQHSGDHVVKVSPLIHDLIGDLLVEDAFLDVVAGHLLAAARGDQDDGFARFLDRGCRAKTHAL